MLKLVFCLRRQPHLSREAFHRYWREEHAPRVVDRMRALGAIRYVQLKALEGPLAQAVAGSRGGPEPYDGVAEVYWESLDTFMAGTGSEAGHAAGADLMADEQSFIDLAHSPIFLAEAHFESESAAGLTDVEMSTITGEMTMNRFPPLAREDLTDEQRKVYDDIAAGPRSGVRGPFNAFLRSPKLADAAQRLGAFLRYETSLPPALSEMAIIITARAWTAQYEWFAHARLAREGGLPDSIIDAIAHRRQPTFQDEKQEALYNFCSELHETHGVEDATYAKAVEAFGEQGVAEIIGLCGYYVMVAMTLNVARVQLPEGTEPPLPV